MGTDLQAKTMWVQAEMVKTDTQDTRLRGQDRNGVLSVEEGKGNLRRKTCSKSGGEARTGLGCAAG